MIGIFNENCLTGMKEIPTGSVDMILTDLPYGITDCEWDRRIPLEPLWEQFWRVTKHNAAIVLFSQMPFGAELIMSQLKFFHYEWIWEKSLGCGFLNTKRMPLRCHENLLVFYRRLPTYNPQFTQGKPYQKARRTFSRIYREQKPTRHISDGRRYPRDVIYRSLLSGTGVVHPTQKPVDLLEYMIRTYTNEGETVLDATMGSGSTGVACVNTDRQFIGFETDEQFFKIAETRINEALATKTQELF